MRGITSNVTFWEKKKDDFCQNVSFGVIKIMSNKNIKVIDGVIQLTDFDDLQLDNPPEGKVYLYMEDDDGDAVFKVKKSDGTVYKIVGVLEE